MSDTFTIPECFAELIYKEDTSREQYRGLSRVATDLGRWYGNLSPIRYQWGYNDTVLPLDTDLVNSDMDQLTREAGDERIAIGRLSVLGLIDGFQHPDDSSEGAARVWRIGRELGRHIRLLDDVSAYQFIGVEERIEDLPSPSRSLFMEFVQNFGATRDSQLAGKLGDFRRDGDLDNAVLLNGMSTLGSSPEGYQAWFSPWIRVFENTDTHETLTFSVPTDDDENVLMTEEFPWTTTDELAEDPAWVEKPRKFPSLEEIEASIERLKTVGHVVTGKEAVRERLQRGQHDEKVYAATPTGTAHIAQLLEN